MQRRICPICDHVMTSAHYCRFCKQWVANPNVVNATYYLNECHKDHKLNERKEMADNAAAELHRRAEQQKRRLEARRQENRHRQERGSGGGRTGQRSEAAGKIFRFVVSFFVLLIFVNIFLPFVLFFIL